MTKISISADSPSFVTSTVQSQLLVDEIDLFQMGQQFETEFKTFSFNAAEPSSINNFPSPEEPEKVYKICGAWIELSQNLITTERQTYSMLEWVGDVGGLLDGLSLLAYIFMLPFTAFTMEAKLFSQTQQKETTSQRSIIQNFIGCMKQDRLYRRQLKKNIIEVRHQLDLVKFIERQQTLMISVLALLSGRQTTLIDRKIINSDLEPWLTRLPAKRKENAVDQRLTRLIEI